MVPDQAHLFEKISLSRATVSRRIQEIGQNISDQLSKAKSFMCFSLAFDESSDIKDTAQLAEFIRGVSSELSVHEDLLGLVSLRGRTRGVDIKEAVVRLLYEKIPDLSLNKLCGLTTDGCPSMTGKENDAVILLKKDAQQSFPHQDILNVHCIIHQESLRAKTLKMDHVMDVVIKCVNEIRTKALKYRQFQSILEEVGAEYGDLIYHCDVRWLSRGKVLERFQNLLEEFRQFLREKQSTLKTMNGKIVLDILSEEGWLLGLSFLVDITHHLNKLCSKIQGRLQLITDLVCVIDAF